MTKSKLLVRPQTTPLTGTITVPADKSISHRAVMLAAIAEGTSAIRNWLPAGDTIATLEAMQAMGVRIEVSRRSMQAWDLTIEGRGLRGLQPPLRPLDCRNAGTCMRLLAGIMVGQSFPSVLDGSEQLRQRPMRRITEPLQQMGANITVENGRAPLSIQPSALRAIEFRLNVASAQVKSAILLAGLYAEGETRVYQPGPARDHTERMLAAMGVDVAVDQNWVILADRRPATLPFGKLRTSSSRTEDQAQGRLGDWQQLAPLDLTLPGDISSAAFPLVAAAIVPHSQITVTNVGVNDTRTGILDMLAAMGARFSLSNERVAGGEPVAALTFSFDELHSADVGGLTVVRGIDELPVWAVAATQAAGASAARDAAELRVKEVDRIGVLAGELRRMGVNIDERSDGFTVSGPMPLDGATVDSHGDHRLGMALAIAGLVARGETIVEDAGCIADSFPGFVETMQTLGANMEWVE